ncbi:MAG TPA: alpha/beta hydrolase [Roseiflexaceae bacterium]|nr:alpha/beta hydrolase [Roseiflexaceae bacterium]
MTVATELEQHLLRAEGHALHYVATGDPSGELVVLLHPAFGDHRCFAGQLGALAERYRVVAVDMLGHGRSQVEDAQGGVADTGGLVAALIAREGRGRAHLVGVSLGSLIAQDVAARFPEVVRSLTVVGGYPIAGVDKALRRAQLVEMLTWLPLMLVSMRLFRRYVARKAAWTSAAREQFERSAQLFTRRSFRAMAGLDRIMRPGPQSQRQPLQIVVGEHELPPVRRAAEDWHRREPDSLLRIIPDAGHCANMDNPAVFNAHLLAFLEGVG